MLASRTALVWHVMFLAAIALGNVRAQAAVVIISNRTQQRVEFSLTQGEASKQQHVLEGLDLEAIPVNGPVALSFATEGAEHVFGLKPNSIYYFSSGTKKLEFGEIGLEPAAGQVDFSALMARTEHKAQEGAQADSGRMLRIPVRILVDEEERAARKAWEERLRRRVAAASGIFEKHCRVRFDVVAVDTWESDDAVTNFQQSLAEFEQEVGRESARLAIGFTSQYEFEGSHLGGTRSPLHSHILIRESHRKYSRPERLEVLVHELGHFLGAVHSPEADSVMRPVLADNQSVARRFRIQFDPLNALAINVMADALRENDVWGLSHLTLETRAQLARVYSQIVLVFPQDPAAKAYLAFVSPKAGSVNLKVTLPVSILASARRVRRAVVEAAEQNHLRPSGEDEGQQGRHRRTGDELTELYFRAAAGAAKELPRSQAAVALSVGLAIALDRSRHEDSVLGRFNALFESPGERRQRLEVLGNPTMWRRADLAMHFSVSAALAAMVGESPALQIGLAKEMSDSQGGSGFSFADLSADLAGIAFARHLKAGELLDDARLTGFQIEDFFPDPSRLPEGLSQASFESQYGSAADARFRDLLKGIEVRIEELPAYRKSSTGTPASKPDP